MASDVLVSICTAALLYGFYRHVLFPALLAPLSRIPTPHWSCSFSSLWILGARKGGFENRSLRDAHLRLGPVVLVAPNTLSVHGLDAVRFVYQGGFDKWPWYSVFDNYGVSCIFSTLGAKEHSLRKRMISNVYSKSYIQASPAARAQTRAILAGRLLPLLRDEASGAGPEGTEVQSIFMATAMDLISAYILGLGNSTNFLQDKPYRFHWLRLYFCRHSHHFWPQELPGLTLLCSKLGLRLYPSHVDAANEELRDWNKDLCDKARDSFLADEAGPGDEAVVYKAILDGMDKDGSASVFRAMTPRQRDLSIASEVLDQVLAGHETTGIALTFLAWHLSQRPGLQSQLRQELLTLTPEADTPDSRKLDRLPLLNAVVMETLRLHAPIPGPQPRSTPPAGCNIGGFDIPQGVRIAALAHTLHLDERVYPDAGRWDHTRWLDEEAGGQGELRRYFWAFGSGGRMCIGSNFAINGMKHVIAAIYSHFETSVMADLSLEQVDGYTSRPARERLFLRFKAI